MDDHGRLYTYNKGCRCDECKKASRDYFKERRKRGLPEGDPRHGTENAVRNFGCKCGHCAEVVRKRKRYPLSEEYEHGTSTGYGVGCRCEPCKDYKRNTRFRTKYGVTLQDYNRILSEQGGVCASCKEPPVLGEPRHALDHQHATGKIRGVLCNQCNTALGLLKEDRNRMLALVDYIDSWT